MKRLILLFLILSSSLGFCAEINPYYHYTFYQGYGWGKDKEATFGNSITNDLCQASCFPARTRICLYSSFRNGQTNDS